ncbi:MAG: FKBP-type peptidyl-prolyl cis-trans isomerase [Acidimicrobiales bacterium]
MMPIGPPDALYSSAVRRLLIAAPLLLGLVLAGCGSSPSSSPNSSPSTTLSSPASGTSHTSNTSGSTSTTSTTGASTTSAPAVADPTNLQVQPVISPGTPPPPSKLVTKDLVIGSGTEATTSSTVVVKYVGADFTTGTDFTSGTWTSNQPASFPLSTVVPGFREGIVGMKVGGRREIVIPSSLGYGTRGSPPTIKPNEALVFVVDLQAVK